MPFHDLIIWEEIQHAIQLSSMFHGLKNIASSKLIVPNKQIWRWLKIFGSSL